jgi:hypothetical protein
MSKLWTPELSRSNRKLWSPDGGFHAFMGRGRIRNPDGSVAWEEDWQLNTFANEGEAEVLNVLFLASQAVRANYYLMLLTATPTNTTTLATMTELVGTGYSRQAIASADWGALSGTQPTSTTAAEKVFGPNSSGGDWTAITYVALGTVASGTSGKFILFVALSGSTLIHNLQSFEYTVTASMS